MDGDVGVGGAQVVREVFGHGLDGGLGGVVAWVAGRVGDALLAAGQDDGGRLGGFLEQREESGEAVDVAEDVDAEGLLEDAGVCPVGFARGGLEAGAGVEHEEVDAGGEGGVDFGEEAGPGGEIADVDFVGFCLGGAG